MKIGVTDTGKPSYKKYVEWLQRLQPLETIKLSYQLNNADAIDKCDGVLLTGGQDVHPKFYGKPEFLSEVDAADLDTHRDEFELQIIVRSQQLPLPMLAICRGLQAVNVALGGTLIPDIVHAGYPSHRLDGSDTARHRVNVTFDSLLKTIVSVSQGEINSRHHQAADKLGKGLKIAAISDDGIIEALELKDRERKPFFLCVQWHPERMNDFENPFSKNILQEFLKAIQLHQQ
jgi:putative glutamine amidotransferase